MLRMLINLKHVRGAIKLMFVGLSLVLVAGCGKKRAEGDAGIEGVGKFDFRVTNGQASLSVVFEKLKIDAGVRIPLNKPAGAFIEITPDFHSVGTLFKISVPLASLVEGSQGLPIVGLPDGRPIPGVRDGALGAVAVDLPVIGESYLYMGADVYGIFLPLEIPNISYIVSSMIRDEKGNVLGTIYGVPKGSRGTISGILFLFPLETGTQDFSRL